MRICPTSGLADTLAEGVVRVAGKRTGGLGILDFDQPIMVVINVEQTTTARVEFTDAITVGIVCVGPVVGV